MSDMAEQVSAGVSGQVDVVIVGGGISGLYTAWRLSKSTNLSVVLLEYTSRFGGRYQTCVMPGGFPADMGAMRYNPAKHPILHNLIEEFNLPTQQFCHMENPRPVTAKHYFRNKHVSSEDELKNLYSVSDADIPYFFPFNDTETDFELSADGNPLNARLKSNDRLAKDMTILEYISLCNNASLITRGHPICPDTLTMADAIIVNRHSKNNAALCAEGSDVLCIEGGMEEIAKTLVKHLSELPNVSLYKSCPVNRIEELAGSASDGFIVSSLDDNSSCLFSVECQKVVLACNGGGMELITWISKHNRTTKIQQLLGQVNRGKSFKIFLTYESFWWENFGLPSGSLLTDLPIRCVSSFSDRGKNCVYATILASYALKDVEIFEGLNNEKAMKYTNTVGEVPPELTPSKDLVDYVQRQIKAVFGSEDIPDPVCAATKIWTGEASAPSIHMPKVGVDHNELYWNSLRPFDNAHVYIIGDTFSPYTENESTLGWSEGALMTAERVLCNHFNLSPSVPSLVLQNQWSSISSS